MFEGVIYKITGICGKVYIGSTTNYHQRKLNHNTNNHTASKKLLKPLQFEIIRTDNYNLMKTMYLVEQYYIDIYKCVNKIRAYHNRFTRNKYNNELRRNKRKNDKHYLQKGRDYNNKRNKIKINCPYCNSLVNTSGLTRHQKSKKCLKFQASINSFN